MFTIQITNTHSFNIHDTPTKEALFLAHGTDEATEFTNPYVSELGLKAPSISLRTDSGTSSGKCHLPAPCYISGSP